jgi:hypothetical protein
MNALVKISRPHVKELRKLREILEEAQSLKTPHWSHEQTLNLLESAQGFIDDGDWQHALECAKKAEANEGRYTKSTQAERYHALLKGLHKKYQETTDEHATARTKPEVSHRAVLSYSVVEVPSVPRVLADSSGPNERTMVESQPSRPAPVDPEHLDPIPQGTEEESGGDEEDGTEPPMVGSSQATLGRATENLGSANGVTPPCCDCGTTERDRGACPFCKQVFCRDCAEKPKFCCDGETAISSPTTEPVSILPRIFTPEHPIKIAQNRRTLIVSFWESIIKRDESDIYEATRACKKAGLEEIYKETLYQLYKEESAYLRAPREIAVKAWEME